jgi:hypothetical protein
MHEWAVVVVVLVESCLTQNNSLNGVLSKPTSRYRILNLEKRVLTASRYRILGACQALNPGHSPSVSGIKSVLRNKTIVIVILSLSEPPLKADEFH